MEKTLTTTVFVICAFLCFMNIEAFVSKCYTCSGSCDNPVPSVQCANSSSINYQCMSADYKTGGKAIKLKNCVENEIANVTCKAFSSYEGSACKVCDTDLCNLSSGAGDDNSTQSQSQNHTFAFVFQTNVSLWWSGSP